MDNERTFLIDARKVAYSKMPEWTGEALKAKYCNRYRYAGAYLGNMAYNVEGAPHKIANIQVGVQGLRRYLDDGYDLILMCGCSNYHNCHLHTIVEHEVFQGALPEVEVIIPGESVIDGMTAAISIRQPWLCIMLNGPLLQQIGIPPKEIENRQWATEYRGELLLHAGKTVDSDLFDGKLLSSYYWTRKFGVEVGKQLHALMPHGKDEYQRGILGRCLLTDVVEWSESCWYVSDQYGLVLESIEAVDPIACNGHRGLFYAPKGIASSDGIL